MDTININCPHNLILNEEYEFNHVGICDNCGSPVVGRMSGIYKGECLGGHHFYLLPPYVVKCDGCKGLITTVTHICGGINVTEEIKVINNESK